MEITWKRILVGENVMDGNFSGWEFCGWEFQWMEIFKNKVGRQLNFIGGHIEASTAFLVIRLTLFSEFPMTPLNHLFGIQLPRVF